jgi:Hemopexin
VRLVAKSYFFSGAEYIRVSRGDLGPGAVDPGYPAPIANWGWGSFGVNGIDDALFSGPKCYFFSGSEYIRVTRGEIGPGHVDAGYPAAIAKWGWGDFGAHGIDAALYSGA